MSCSITCGFSFALGYANALRSGKSHAEALKCASTQMVKSGATSLAVGVGTQQLLRTTVGRSIAATATHSARTIIDATCKTQVGQQVVERQPLLLLVRRLWDKQLRMYWLRECVPTWLLAAL